MVSRDAPEVKLKGYFITCIGHGMEHSKITCSGRSLVPKLQLGNAGMEAPASRVSWVSGGIHKSDEAGASKQVGSQARAWEPALEGIFRQALTAPEVFVAVAAQCRSC